MKESDFQAKLIAGLEWSGMTAHKFPDLARGLVKPYDIVANCCGEFWGVENKVFRVNRSPPNHKLKHSDIIWKKSVMRPKQTENLLKEDRIGGCGMVALLLLNKKAVLEQRAFIAELRFLIDHATMTLGLLERAAKETEEVIGFPFIRELKRIPNVGWSIWDKDDRFAPRHLQVEVEDSNVL